MSSMTIRTEIITLISVFSFVIIITQGSLASTNAVVQGLTNLAAAITIQNNGYTTSENNMEHRLLPVGQQIYDTIHNSIMNVALSSSTTASDHQIPSLTTIFKQVENSVVQITAKTPNPNLQIIINGLPLSNKSTRLGSGFVYDKQGHIITNSHVIDGASTADVTFVDGNTYRAKVIGKDPSSDVAVLQITDNFSSENLVP